MGSVRRMGKTVKRILVKSSATMRPSPCEQEMSKTNALNLPRKIPRL